MSFGIHPLAATEEQALEFAAAQAPFLRRLWEKSDHVPDMDEALAAMRRAVDADNLEHAQQVMRHAKALGHLSIAAADLSARQTVPEVTADLTRLADAAVQTALEFALRTSGLESHGIFVVALGKMGAQELNYSSDIDIAVFYDPDVFDGGSRAPSDAARRVVQMLVRLLDERTPEGYVFRTDLRLRPDPSSTPLAVSTVMAENYYETVGQNWERMVWIKARAVAGDLDTAERFIETLRPFVWRRHLDYWAINDIHAIKRMINSKNKARDLTEPDPDVKLCPGGIREIEFFAQTQQLILGGRDPDLRLRATVPTLQRLALKGIVSQDVANDLTAAYEQLRAIEHRIQMRLDEHTHKLPSDAEARRAIARLCGAEDLESFDRGVSELRTRVHKIYLDLFAEEDRQKATGNLLFTGVDDDPSTVATLTELGFTNPSHLIGTIRRWHRGRTTATRNKRGRELLTALLPRLLLDMSSTGDPDAAFQRFSVFFENLRSGVQTLSMLQAEPKLLDDLVSTLALAPRLGTNLARRPNLLESLLSVPDFGAFPNGLDFEAAMDEMRRQHREREFLIGHELLHGGLGATEAALRYSALADDAIALMAQAAAEECERKFGPAPGPWMVAAMGKLGGQEMTAGSDLDLIIIYDLDDPAAGSLWMTRFTQRLITALSAETGEGALYEVDMRLRPSGRAGPVAVRLPAFERYHLEEAWTWERMALTRIRFITGDAMLRKHFEEILIRIHSSAIPDDNRRADILEMRQRLAREKAGGDWLDFKLAPGGLLDIEFIAQAGLLQIAAASSIAPSTSQAINASMKSGFLSEADGVELLTAHQLFATLQQIQRLAVLENAPETEYPLGLKQRMCKAVGVAEFNQLKSLVIMTKSKVADLREDYIGPLS